MLRIFVCSGYQLAVLFSFNFDECLKQLKLGNCDGFFISRAHGFDMDSIEFLENITEIRALTIMADVDVSTFNAIKYLKNLEYLNFRAKRLPIDIRNLLKLKDLEIAYLDGRIELPDIFPVLEILLLGPFNPKSEGLNEIKFAKNIDILHIVQSNLKSLIGLESFSNLKEIYLSYLPKLEEISELNLRNIELLSFDSCKKVNDFNKIPKFKFLKKLEIINCGSLSDICFIENMPSLTYFNFIKTNVSDGDLSPCLRLDNVRTLNKKHYSHRSDELPGGSK